MEIHETNGGKQITEKIPGGTLKVSIGYSDGNTPQADITFEPTGGGEISLAMVEMKRGELAGVNNPDNRNLDVYIWGNCWDEDFTEKESLDYSEIIQATGGYDEVYDELYVKTPTAYVKLLWSTNDAESEDAEGVVGIYVYDAETGKELDGGELDVFEDRPLKTFVEDALELVGFVNPKLYVLVSREEFEEHVSE